MMSYDGSINSSSIKVITSTNVIGCNVDTTDEGYDAHSSGGMIYEYIYTGSSCGGGVEYLHRDPASRRRRRKGKSQI
jgi:hypothetical protein